MKIDIVEVKEHENGDATISFDCDKEALEVLVSQGMLRILEKEIERFEDAK
jgi:ribosome biogenesis SPOUT family RNA methylase Rps3